MTLRGTREELRSLLRTHQDEMTEYCEMAHRLRRTWANRRRVMAIGYRSLILAGLITNITWLVATLSMRQCPFSAWTGLALQGCCLALLVPVRKVIYRIAVRRNEARKLIARGYRVLGIITRLLRFLARDGLKAFLKSPTTDSGGRPPKARRSRREWSDRSPPPRDLLLTSLHGLRAPPIGLA
jgi:hypothetical protein